MFCHLILQEKRWGGRSSFIVLHGCTFIHVWLTVFFPFGPGAMNFFKNMNIGSLEIADYFGTTTFLFYSSFFPLYATLIQLIFMLSYSTQFLQQLELYFLQQILFAHCKYRYLFCAVIFSQDKNTSQYFTHPTQFRRC